MIAQVLFNINNENNIVHYLFIIMLPCLFLAQLIRLFFKSNNEKYTFKEVFIVKFPWFGFIFCFFVSLWIFLEIHAFSEAKDILLKRSYQVISGKIADKQSLGQKGYYELKIGENLFRNPFGSRMKGIEEGSFVTVYYYHNGTNNIIVFVKKKSDMLFLSFSILNSHLTFATANRFIYFCL